ncbi:MAG: type II toxin-antitoxin system Phd/YefM family antitoxin [Beijerinckiaceae bacterium]
MGENAWKLQDAKARFSEVVRMAKEEGAQPVTKHGKTEVYVVAAEEYEKLSVASKPRRTGQAIIDAFRDPRIRGLKFQRDSVYSPIRDVPILGEEETPAK